MRVFEERCYYQKCILAIDLLNQDEKNLKQTLKRLNITLLPNKEKKREVEYQLSTDQEMTHLLKNLKDYNGKKKKKYNELQNNLLEFRKALFQERFSFYSLLLIRSDEKASSNLVIKAQDFISELEKLSDKIESSI